MTRISTDKFCKIVTLFITIFALNSHAQEQVLPPQDNPAIPENLAVPKRLTREEKADQAFFRASKIYEYGRNHKDYYESRSALKTAELSFRNYLRTYGGHKERQTAYYRMAVCQLLTGKIESAEANFEFIIDKYKRGQLVAASAFRMGAQRYNEEKYKSGQYYFNIAAQQSEKPGLRHQALYQQARCLMLGDQKKRALNPLNKLIKEEGNPYQNSARLALGHIFFELSEYQNALRQFKALSELQGVDNDTKAEARLYTGICHARLGNTTDAVDIIAKTIDTPGIKNEYKAKAQYELFDIYYKNEKFDELVERYQKGVYPGEPISTARSYLLAGYALLKKGAFQRAVTAFTSVERLTPNSALSFEASYRRLYCFYQLDGANIPDQADAFQELYSSYQKDKPWHKIISVFKAESLYHSGRVEEAAKTYRSIDSKILPAGTQANFLYKKMIALAETGDNTGAISAGGHFLADFPAHDLVYEVLTRRGNYYLVNTNYTAALTDFQKVLKERPDSELAAVALQGMITSYRKDRKYEELVEASDLLVKKFPGLKKSSRAHALYWKGWGLFKQEKFAEAIVDLEQARQLSPQFYKEPAGTRIFLSTYYLQDSDKMKEAYKRVIADVPGKYFPPRIIAWLGIQRFQKEDYLTSATVLDKIANREDPLETPIDVWRYLAKANLKIRDYNKALDAVEHVIQREQEEFWKSDAYLDKSQALLGLNKLDEAIIVSEEGLHFQPKGTIEAGLRFSMAEAKLRNGDLDDAKDEVLLVASKYESDTTIRPYALWKSIKIFESQGNPAAESMSNTLKTQYPNWNPPEE